MPETNAVQKMNRGALVRAMSAGLAAAVLAGASMTSWAAEPVRLRGSIEKRDASGFMLRDHSGKQIRVATTAQTSVSETVPISVDDIKPGSFVGSAAVPGANGMLKSLEVLVFPEAARGTGEGHYAWDLLPESTMTNATVTGIVGSTGVTTMSVRYKDPKTGDGQKTLMVPEGTPVVTVKPGTAALLKNGAKVFVVATSEGGKPVAQRIIVGHEGAAPPM